MMLLPDLEEVPRSKDKMRKVLISIFLLLPLVAVGYGQDTGGVKGKVRTSSGGGIAGASVTARQDGKDIRSATSDKKGDFVLDGLRPGLYNLVFEAAGYSNGVLYNVEVKKKKVADLGDRLMLTVDRGTQVLVHTSVFYSDGTSITAAKVELFNVNSDGTTRRLATGTTNISGEYTFHLKEGTAKLRITASANGVSASKDIDVSEAAIYRLAISLNTTRR